MNRLYVYISYKFISITFTSFKVQIERKLSQRTEGVDVGYWESLLSQLKAHLARARLRDKHSESLRRKLELLKNEQGIGSPDQDQEAMEDEEVKEEDFEIDDHVENQEEIKTDSADETTVDNTPLLDYATGSYRFGFLFFLIYIHWYLKFIYSDKRPQNFCAIFF